MPDVLELERLLQKASAERSNQFPLRGADYYATYVNIKARLKAKYYDVAGAGLAASGGRFTKHDINHVNDVIETAGSMLGAGEAHDVSGQLDPYEIFVLLLAILLHDAGNASARAGHETAPRAILMDLGSLTNLNALEIALISSIATAHGGDGPDGDRNTIGTLIREVETHINNLRVRGRRIAALVRLADELSERPSRADEVALQRPYPSPSSVLHNLFCKVINIHVDPRGETISIQFDINKSLLSEKFTLNEHGKERSVYLVDYIADRVDKCELERQYCNRFLSGLVIYNHLRVTLRIYDEASQYPRPIDEVTLELPDPGYPRNDRRVGEREPRFDGSSLEIKHCRPPAEDCQP